MPEPPPAPLLIRPLALDLDPLAIADLLCAAQELDRATADILTSAAIEMPVRRYARRLKGLARWLQSPPIQRARLADQLGGLSPHLLVAIRQGLATRRLGSCLAEAGEHYRRSRMDRLSLLSVLAYPSLVCLLTICLAMMLSTQFIPAFRQIFADFGTKPPAITLLVFWVFGDGVAVSGQSLLFLVGAAAVVRLVGGRVGWTFLWWTSPVLGPTLVSQAIAEFTRSLALLLRYQVSLVDALTYVSRSSANAVIGRVAAALAKTSQRGMPLAQALNRSQLLPPSLTPLIAWGELHDRLPEALETASEIYESRMRHQNAWLGMIFPVLAYVGIGLAAGCVVLAMMLPLVTLIQIL